MEKIKGFITNCVESERGKDVMIIIIVILVGLGSFELGRLSKENSGSGIKIEYPNASGNQPANAVSAVTPTPVSEVATALNSKQFFASKTGSKYYSLGCSGGKTIKQENRVYFASTSEAETAGYTLSSSCK